jgi:hypothetical protein
MLEALVTQRTDARFGLFIATAGFALQWLGALMPSAPSAWGFWFLAFLGIALAMFLALRRCLIGRDTVRLAMKRKSKSSAATQ